MRFFNKWCWHNWVAIWKKVKLAPYFIPHIRINSKCNKNFNVKYETIQLLEENMSELLFNLSIGKVFHDSKNPKVIKIKFFI